MKRIILIAAIFLILAGNSYGQLLRRLPLFPASGGGSFPTTSILDDFNRADVDPLSGGSWSTTPIWNGTQIGRIVSNQYAGNDENNHPFWNVSFNANSEVYVTIANPTNMSYLGIICRGADMNSGSFNPDYYALEWSASDNRFNITVTVDGSDTTIATSTQTFSAGDSIGLSCNGSTIKSYYKASGGSWTERSSVTDTGVTAGGYIGYMFATLNTAATRLDDFGGGNIP